MELTKEQLQKHGEVILAWANGAEVEVKGFTSGKWISGFGTPTWNMDCTYRVKPQPTYQERHDQWVKETGIKVGDTVRIVRGFTTGECGDIHWCDDMSKMVGKVGVVDYLFEYGIRVAVKMMDFSFPYFCLEVKEPTYRPYTFEEAREHLWGAKIVRKSDGFLAIADRVDKTGTGSYSPERYFNEYTYLDGSPCGTQETPQES